MKTTFTAFLFILTFFTTSIYAQKHALKVTVSVSNEIIDDFKNDGRIFLFVNPNTRSEPRLNTFPNQNNLIFATNISKWNPKKTFTFDQKAKLVKSVDISLGALPAGNYRVQVLWDQDTRESQINAPGNLYSNVIDIELNENKNLEITLGKIIEPQTLSDNKFLKEVNYKSALLSAFWEKDMYIKAAVLLPKSFYNQPEKKYPVRYNIAGYGGRYTRANNYVDNKSFMDWWFSEEGSEIITVFLDGEGPFGDSYQLDSENSGPYGSSLTEELIPYIEKEYHGIGTPESRFLDGCSTGGWVSLALQLFYPDYFNGCFSYSPDQVDFENCQLINIYKDNNAFYNEFGYLRPIVRDVTGEPMVSQKDFILFENVQGSSDTYLNSGGQFSAFTALFSPKDKNNLPKPLFDPVSGEIDKSVVEFWKKHDLKDYVKTNWKTLGPKIQGKIWVWMGDMDNFYLNPALRAFNEMLQKQTNPGSDAEIHFSPMKGHCAEYDFIKVYTQINDRINK